MTQNNPQIPNQAMPVIVQGGKASQVWFTFWQALASSVNNIVTGVLSFNGRQGAVILTDSDVIGALGFEPGTGDGDVTTSGEPQVGQVAVFTGAKVIGGLTIPYPDVSPVGFGFFSGGLLNAGELLATVVWGNPRVFEGTPQDVAMADFAPTGVAVLTVQVAGSPVGTITFNHSNVGVLAWLGSVAIAAGTALGVVAPPTQDPTFANVRVMAYASV